MTKFDRLVLPVEDAGRGIAIKAEREGADKHNARRHQDKGHSNREQFLKNVR